MNTPDIYEHLSVDHNRTIIGTLHAGATIRNGAQLTVSGAVAGVVTVEEESTLMVQGSFNGSVASNKGTIILYGQAALDLDAVVGNVAIGVNSVITTPQGVFRLMPDGSLNETQDGSLNVHGDHLCYFDPRTNRFEPLGGLSSNGTTSS